jgi:hypothetical protein
MVNQKHLARLDQVVDQLSGLDREFSEVVGELATRLESSHENLDLAKLICWVGDKMVGFRSTATELECALMGAMKGMVEDDEL